MRVIIHPHAIFFFFCFVPSQASPACSSSVRPRRCGEIKVTSVDAHTYAFRCFGVTTTRLEAPFGVTQNGVPTPHAGVLRDEGDGQTAAAKRSTDIWRENRPRFTNKCRRDFFLLLTCVLVPVGEEPEGLPHVRKHPGIFLLRPAAPRPQGGGHYHPRPERKFLRDRAGGAVGADCYPAGHHVVPRGRGGHPEFRISRHQKSGSTKIGGFRLSLFGLFVLSFRGRDVLNC